MFWIGCGADANPMPRRKIEQAKQYGKELAETVADSIKTAKPTKREFHFEVRENHAQASSHARRPKNNSCRRSSQQNARGEKARRTAAEGTRRQGKIADTYGRTIRFDVGRRRSGASGLARR